MPLPTYSEIIGEPNRNLFGPGWNLDFEIVISNVTIPTFRRDRILKYHRNHRRWVKKFNKRYGYVQYVFLIGDDELMVDKSRRTLHCNPRTAAALRKHMEELNADRKLPVL